MFSMQDIGKRIFTLRKDHNMAQADVKEFVGVLLDEGKDCTSYLPFLGAQGVKELMSRYVRG